MKTYFYKRKDGSIFATEAREASLIHSKYQQVGVSDGKVFEATVREARQKLNEVKARVKGVTDSGQTLTKKLSAELAKAKIEYNKKHIEGTEAEIKAAEGHFENPPNTEWSSMDGQATRDMWHG